MSNKYQLNLNKRNKQHDVRRNSVSYMYVF